MSNLNKTVPLPPDPLGFWFHRPTGEKTFNQGQVIRKVNDVSYELQLYSFLDGYPTDLICVPANELPTYKWFISDKDMRDYFATLDL